MARRLQFTIGKIVTPLHTIILWAETSERDGYGNQYTGSLIVDNIFYGEVATVLAEDHKDGWIRLLSVRGKIGLVRCIDLRLIT